jgi:hypothetical protein
MIVMGTAMYEEESKCKGYPVAFICLNICSGRCQSKDDHTYYFTRRRKA